MTGKRATIIVLQPHARLSAGRYWHGWSQQEAAKQEVLQEPLYDRSIPSLMPVNTLIGRDEEMQWLQEQILSTRGIPLAAISGLPGIGKTMLVLDLMYNQEVREQFDGGILWAALGPDANLYEILSRWESQLSSSAGDATNPATIEMRASALRVAMGQRRFLVVLDDAWHLRQALQCLVGGARCAYVLTTRFPQIALAFAGARTIALDTLDDEESAQLIQCFAPEEVEQEQVSDLVQIAGGLPLALTLMGNYLRHQSHSGQSRHIRAALASLRDTHIRLCLTQPRHLPGCSSCLSGEAVSLETAIAQSDQRLDESARRALRMISVFSPRPGSFSAAAALAVCQVPVAALDTLSDAGLLESVAPGRYALHRIIADYARVHRAEIEPSAESSV